MTISVSFWTPGQTRSSSTPTPMPTRRFYRLPQRCFGSQCIVSSIDVRKAGDRYEAVGNCGTYTTGFEALDWARRVEQLGAGEIFLTSITEDGRGNGYDLKLVKSIADSVSIPVIASGGRRRISTFGGRCRGRQHFRPYPLQIYFISSGTA